MENKNTAWHRLEKFLDGKGFYIVLFACIAVIGVSAGMLILAENGDEATDVALITDNDDSDVFNDSTLQDETDVASSNATKPDSNLTSNPATNNNENTDETSGGKDTQNSETETEDEPETTSNTLVFIWPVVGEVEVGYFKDELIYNKTMADWRTHPGVDIAANIGQQVKAVADGTVESVLSDDLYGTTVVIDHGDGLKSMYANLASEPTVSEGDHVAMGAVIGSVGDTALAETNEVQHLHFEMTKDGINTDPAEYLPKR